MKSISWLSIPAILITFLYILVPAFLWLTDRIFKKPLGASLFRVQWHPIWITLAVLLWIADRVWVYFAK